jgi:hypothetical protein
MDDENALTVCIRDRGFYEAAVKFYGAKLDESSSTRFGPFEISIGKTMGGVFCWPGEWPYLVYCECDSNWRWIRVQIFIAIFRELWAFSPGVCAAEDDNGFTPFFSTRRRFVINTMLVEQYIQQCKHPVGWIGAGIDTGTLNSVLSGAVTFMDGSRGFPENILDE